MRAPREINIFFFHERFFFLLRILNKKKKQKHISQFGHGRKTIPPSCEVLHIHRVP